MTLHKIRLSKFIYLLALTVISGLGGCLPSEYQVEIRASFPQDVALVGLEITALPFDRDSLRESLYSASTTPRPQFPDLEAELISYGLPDLSGLEESFLPWQAIRDSVHHLADSLNIAGSDSSPQYAGAYDRLRDLYRRLAQSAAVRDAAVRTEVGDDRQLAMRAAAAADSLRAWEGFALSQFPELADSALALSGRGIHIATTNNEGVAEFTLTPGRWWIVTTWIDPNNPFREYYWNVAVTVRLLGSRSIPLIAENGTERWRY